MDITTRFQDAISYYFQIGKRTELGTVKCVNLITIKTIDVTFFNDTKLYGFLYHKGSDSFQLIN